jgi:hypothetical protein
MRDVWEIDLALGPYPFAEILAQFEFGAKFYAGYRDHVLHQLRVYLLGLYLVYGCKHLRTILLSHMTFSEFLIAWKVAALSHDHGYLFEIKGAEQDTWVINKVLPALNNSLAYPLSSLADRVRHKMFTRSTNKTYRIIYQCLDKRRISHTLEKRMRSELEVFAPEISTVNDLMEFRGLHLFDWLKDAAINSTLSYPQVNGLDAYFQFASVYAPNDTRGPFFDHGVVSALLLLLQARYYEYYFGKLQSTHKSKLSKMGVPEEVITFIRSFTQLFYKNINCIDIAARAVAVHNISPSTWSQSLRNLAGC